MTRALTPPSPVTLAAFDEMFEAVKNWGRWGPDDELGTPQLHHSRQDRGGHVARAQRPHPSR